jgi:hypothetical protein
MFAASKTAGVVSAAPPASTDPQFNYVAMLLNDTGTNGQQNNTFLDSSSNNFTITRNGTPTQGSVTPYWPDGQWSNYFNGSSDYVTTPSSASYQFGTGDFTIEAWVYSTSSANRSIIDARGSSSAAPYAFYIDGSNFPYFYDGTVYTSTVAAPPNQWNHVAVSRASGTLRMFVNGVQGFSGTVTTALNPAATFYIGGQNFATPVKFPGYLSNLRLVKGTALYTANFTPSTTPLTAVSGTSLLTCQSNRFKDNSSNNFAITVTGAPTVQAFDPFSPSASYSTATYGGSAYFPGSTSGLRTNYQPITTGPFTVEFWINPDSYKSSMIAVSNRAWNTGNNRGWWIEINSTGQLVLKAGQGGFASWPTILTSSGKAPFSQWTHVACVRDSSNVIKFYINGIADSSTVTYSASLDQNSGTPTGTFFTVGVEYSDNVYQSSTIFVGYMTSVRINPTNALYTANFTTPTLPPTAVSGTTFLLNATSAGIYDAAVINDLTTIGDSQVSTAQAKWGASSVAFDGTGDWLTFVDNPTMQLGTSDFTIEGWLYLPLLGTARGIVSKGTSTTGWSVGVNLLNQFTFSYTSSTLTAATALTMGQWVHFAVVRSGSATGNVKIYFNGVLDATSSGAITDNFNQTSIGYVGADRVGTSPMNGYIDDLRITKGYTRYTANFTPPTAAFPTR